MQQTVIGRMFSAGLLLAVAACSQNSQSGPLQAGQFIGGGTRQIPVSAAPGTFLPDRALLKPGGKGRADLVYIDPQADPASFRQVLLEPVAVWADPGSDFSKVPANQQAALANAFYASLYKDLAAHCRMATAPAPDTLRIRVALVDARATNPVVTTIATYAPYVDAAYSLEALTLNHGVGYFAGTATAEAYATNAATGALVWEGLDRRGGTTAMIENTTDRWLDVHHVLTLWSSQLAAKLRSLAACQG